MWLVFCLAPALAAQARLDPVAVDSASLLPLGLTGRHAPAQADEPAWRTWHLRGLDGPAAELRLSLTLALGGPDDRADLAIAYDNTSWIPIDNVRWRVGPREIDLSPWVRPGRFRVRLTLIARRPERCWFSDASWHGSGVASDSPQEAWLPNACWWQPALAARRDKRLAMGLPPSAVEPVGGGRLEASPVADWEPCAEGWRAVGLSLPRGEQVALVLDGQAEGAGLRLGRDTELSHRLPYAPVGVVLDAETLANPPALVVLTRDRPVLRAVVAGPLALRQVACRRGADGGLSVEAVVVNVRRGAVDGHLRVAVGAPGPPVASGYRFPPGPSVVTVPIHSLSADSVMVEVDDGQRISDSAAAPVLPR